MSSHDQKETKALSPPSLCGFIHTYQKFHPMNLPSPTAPPPDVVSQDLDRMLYYGSTRRLTEEELARAVRLDPNQLRDNGPNLEWLKAILLERKRKILSTYETDHVQKDAHDQFHDRAAQMDPPGKLRRRFAE